MIAQNVSSLRIFSLGQLIAAVGGAGVMGLLWAALPGIPLADTLILCAIAALGAVATLALIRLSPQLATMVFVVSGILAIALSVRIVGVGNGSAAEFVWPISVAAMLRGRWAGISTTLLCIALVIVATAWESAASVVILNPVAGRYIGIVTVIIALALAAIVALVAGGNIKAALVDAEEKATRLAVAYGHLTAGLQREQETKAVAENLADGLMSSSQQQQGTATDAASAIGEISAQVQELSAAAHQIALSAHHVLELGSENKELIAAVRMRLTADSSQLDSAVEAGEEMLTQAQEMGDAGRETNKLLDLITDIAHESHILTLNAKIEAAQAGTLGRRFDVVAEQFSELADHSHAAVQEASRVVERIGTRAARMMVGAEVALASVRQSQQASAETARQTVAVEQAVAKVADECIVIVSATAQQEQASTLIAQAVQIVSGLSREAASQSEQLGSFAQSLNQTVNMLGNAASLPQLVAV